MYPGTRPSGKSFSTRLALLSEVKGAVQARWIPFASLDIGWSQCSPCTMAMVSQVAQGRYRRAGMATGSEMEPPRGVTAQIYDHELPRLAEHESTACRWKVEAGNAAAYSVLASIRCPGGSPLHHTFKRLRRRTIWSKQRHRQYVVMPSAWFATKPFSPEQRPSEGDIPGASAWACRYITMRL